MGEKAGKQRRINETLAELLIGIAVSGILLQLIFVWLVKDTVSFAAGLWIGVSLAAFLAWHMWKGIDEALDRGEAGAQKLMRTRFAFRYGIVILVLGILMGTEVADPLAAFLGIMTLKVAAYLQPVTHKAILKLRR
ncbi:ATP synthase subunit I [Lachnospiraceae bacterium JLR.KK008]